MIGANSESAIASLIYGITDLSLLPFVGLINSPASGIMVLELSSLFAIAIYALLAWVTAKIVWLLFYRSHGPVEEVIETTTSDERST